jgi:hypothetical protein
LGTFFSSSFRCSSVGMLFLFFLVIPTYEVESSFFFFILGRSGILPDYIEYITTPFNPPFSRGDYFGDISWGHFTKFLIYIKQGFNYINFSKMSPKIFKH